MIALQNNLKQLLRIKIVLLIIFTAFFISCVLEEENPEFLESIFFDTEFSDTEGTDLTGTWDLYYDWSCDGVESSTVSITLNSDGTFLGTNNEGWTWSGQAGTVSLDAGSGECEAVTIDFDASFLYDSSGTVYYLAVEDEDILTGYIDSWADGTNDGTTWIAREGTDTGPSITVTSPNGGEYWEPGTSHSITWSSSDAGSNVIIYLYKNDVSYSTIVSPTANDGSYTWSISSSQSESDYYQVKIVDYYDSGVYDLSDDYFTVEESTTASITITSPNGGENWEQGTSHSITWSSSDAGSYVIIYLYKNNVSYSTISSFTPNDGSYTWSISSSQSESDYYQVKIVDYYDSGVYDLSDDYFTIEESTPYYVEIGTGSYNWGYPFYTYYHDARTQILYLSSEISTSGTIDKIAFYVTSIPGQTMFNFTVRMKHTGFSSYASTSFDNSGYTTCLSDTIAISSTGWVEIPLTTSFSYNGSSNLIVDVSFDNTSYSQSGNARSFTSSNYRTIHYVSDSNLGDPLNWNSGNRTAYVPNIRLYFE